MFFFELFIINIIYLRYGGLDRDDVIPYIFINIGLVVLTYTNVSMFHYILICCGFVILSYIISYTIFIYRILHYIYGIFRKILHYLN